MYYAKIENGIAAELENALYEWDENNYCTPAALMADGKADQFDVVQVAFVSAPAHDPVTQYVSRDGCEFVDGQWQYKWRVDALSAEKIVANQAAAAQSLQDAIVNATQARLDAFSKTRRYDGILSACTYATSSIPQFAAEGQAAVNARDATWAALYALMAQAESGAVQMPASFADVEPALPVLEWPV